MKLIKWAAVPVLAVALTACGSSVKTADQAASSSATSAGGLVGVTMPTKSSERWIHDGDNTKASLEKLGYQVDLQYAENDIPTQVNQIENQITKGAKLLVIASIDGTAITTQLQEAADKKIPVIAYDRLIRNSPNVDYYATFDNFKVGVEQATSLLTGLGIKKADGTDTGTKGPFNVDVNWDYTSRYAEYCSTCTEVPRWPATTDPFSWVTASAHYRFLDGFDVYIEGRNLTNAIARTYLNGNSLLPWAPGQLVGQSASGVGLGYSAYGRSYVAGLSYRF